MLNIEKTIDEGKAVFALDGRLDTVSAPQLEQSIRESLEGTTELILDLEKLEYISSAGLRVLLAAQKQMNSLGEMKVVRVKEAVMGIFEVTGFADILTIE